MSHIVPAGCPDAITVGALGKSGDRASFSNMGTGVDLYAPGVDIYTTGLGNSYITKDGTSFAAPIVAGLVSKELAYDPSLSYDTILQNLTNHSPSWIKEAAEYIAPATPSTDSGAVMTATG